MCPLSTRWILAVFLAGGLTTGHLCQTVARSDEAAQADEAVPHLGKIITIKPALLAIRDADGKERRFVIPDTATITLDGKAAKLADLKPGQTAKVTADPAGTKSVATVVEVTSQAVTPKNERTLSLQSRKPTSDPAPAPRTGQREMVTGILHMVGGEALVLLVHGEEQQFAIRPGTPVRKDGQQVQLAALAPRDLFTLAGERIGTDLRITRVDARSAY